MVKKNPCSAEDFRSQADLNRARTADPCRRLALSVYLSLVQAKHCRDKYPHLGPLVAKGLLSAQHGVVRLDGGDHAAWWPFDGLVCHSLFAVVPEAV